MIELLNDYRVPAHHLTSLVLAVAIWRWGGGPERWLIAVFITTMVAPMYLVYWFGIGAAETSAFAGAYVALDLLAAGLFVLIALNANRNYPLWVAGFQLVAVVAHLVKALIDSISPLAYAVLVIGPSYCQLLVLLGGFVRHRLRERRFGPYREWRVAPSIAAWAQP